MANKNVKKRYWAFILYPESAPEDWYNQLVNSGLQGEISPLHDKDVNQEIDPETGKRELKKAHYHIILCYGSPTTYNNVKGLTDRLNQPQPMPLDSIRGMDRYLTHMDNPDKYQYDRAEVRAFGGFCISDFVELSASEKQALRVKVMGIIRDADITEYSDLLDLLLDSDMPDELETAMSNTILFRGYIESRRCSIGKRQMREQMIDIASRARAELTDKPKGKGGKVISLAGRKECGNDGKD